MKLKVNKEALDFETLIKNLPRGRYQLDISNVYDKHWDMIRDNRKNYVKED